MYICIYMFIYIYIYIYCVPASRHRICSGDGPASICLWPEGSTDLNQTSSCSLTCSVTETSGGGMLLQTSVSVRAAPRLQCSVASTTGTRTTGNMAVSGKGLSVYISVYIHPFTHRYTHMYIHIYVYICIHIGTCVYIYICLNTYMYMLLALIFHAYTSHPHTCAASVIQLYPNVGASAKGGSPQQGPLRTVRPMRAR